MAGRTGRLWWQTALGYGLAVVFGGIAYRLRVPLAWVLGPLVAAALLSLTGFGIVAPVILRQSGQVITGATIGLGITATVAAGMVRWLPLMILTGFIAVLISAASSVGFRRLANVDQKTAFFATLPGGLAEMANIGASAGATGEPIAIAQAVRAAVVVLTLPPLLIAAGLGATPPTPTHVVDVSLPQLGFLVITGGCVAALFGWMRLNNPWMVGSLVASSVLTSFGFVDGRMPTYLFFAAQLFIGFSIGARFRREVIGRLPRVAFHSAVFVVFFLTVMAIYAALLAAVTDLDLPTAILATAPGGMTEMAVTAQALQLSAALVTSFHVCRALTVNGFATHYWSALNRLGFFEAIERAIRRIGTIV